MVFFLLVSLTGLKSEELVSINFNNVDIRVVVKFVSEVTGKNFLLDEQVRGTVTVISPTKIPVDEVYKVFESILEVKGFTAIPAGKVIKIVPARVAKQSPVSISIGKEAEKIPFEDRIITQLIPLEYADASQILSLLSPLVSPHGNITVYSPTNTLICTDFASNMKKIATIVQTLDKPGARMETTIIPLQYASATEVSQILTQVLESLAGKKESIRRITPRARTLPTLPTGGVSLARIIPEERTNSLIVVANPQDTERIKKLVSQLDKPAPRGKERIQVYYLKNADAEDLAKILTSTPLLKKGKGEKRGIGEEISIVADKSTNSLIISASPQDYEEILKVIEKLDVVRPQVLVEALIADVSMDKLFQLGIEWTTLDKAVEEEVRGFGGTRYSMEAANLYQRALQMEGLMVGLMKGTTEGVPNIGALLQAYSKDTGFRVLSTPHILTLDNEEAKIVVGQNVPFVTSSRITEQETVVRSYEYRDVGIILTITPHINPEGFVKLKIHQTVTNLAPEAMFAEAPVTAKREAETTVTVKDKSTVVIGGLIRNDKTEVLHKVPVLGDIPVVGVLFRRKETTMERRNLLIFLTPHIIRTPEEAEALKEEKEKTFKQGILKEDEIP